VLNPASNVKMISTATALELLGADFRYPTRVLGPTPTDGAIHGNVYLLGSYDPTLAASDLDEIATQLADKGGASSTADVVVGSDPTRDGIYRAIVPIVIKGGAPGDAPTVTAPAGYDLSRQEHREDAQAWRRPRGADLQGQRPADGHRRARSAARSARAARPRTSCRRTERTGHAANVAPRRAARAPDRGVIGGQDRGARRLRRRRRRGGSLPVELGRHDSHRSRRSSRTSTSGASTGSPTA
jgi:hypothetical protein